MNEKKTNNRPLSISIISIITGLSGIVSLFALSNGEFYSKYFPGYVIPDFYLYLAKFNGLFAIVVQRFGSSSPPRYVPT